jgi:hypothetical protein
VSHYALGELEVVPSRSQPAPALVGARSEPTPSHATTGGQPAAAPIKSQPAPALKSQPAPALKSQPAPAQDLGLEAAGLRMFGEGFDDAPDDGPALELDERATGPQTNRIEVQPRELKQAVHNTRKRRGFFATLLLPLVLFQAAIPQALALTGVAAASGAAVYLARTSGRDEAKREAGETRLSEPSGNERLSKPSGNERLSKPSGNDKQLDDVGLAPDLGEKKASGAAPSHPLVRLSPKAMEGSIASILRTRFRGLHKVAIKWDEATKPEGHVECMLLEEAEAANLKELASTGTLIEIPSYVREQLQDHIVVLRTANADQSAGYLPVCLAN